MAHGLIGNAEALQKRKLRRSLSNKVKMRPNIDELMERNILKCK